MTLTDPDFGLLAQTFLDFEMAWPNDISFMDHELRASLTEEMHARKFPSIQAPVQIMQVVALTGGAPPSGILNHLAKALHTASGLSDEAKYLCSHIHGTIFVWERHSEFCTYTFIQPGESEAVFSYEMFGTIDPAWLASIPGEVIRATRIAILPDSPTTSGDAGFHQYFTSDDLIVCDVAGGRARIYSDFRLHDDNFGRLLILDKGLVGQEAAQVFQRLQELGNYRKIALLGLPAAQSRLKRLSELESELAELTGSVSERESDAGLILADLSRLSAEIAHLLSATQYRMSASRAYGQIAQDRLNSLEVAVVQGYQTLVDFTERRLLPALRTCASFTDRLDNLARRAEWTSALLRTRVDTAIAEQNRDLLTSMNRRTLAQLRLQQAVEGLSVVAISYYALALTSYVVKAAHVAWPFFEPDLVTGAIAPALLLSVWRAIHVVRRRWSAESNISTM